MTPVKRLAKNIALSHAQLYWSTLGLFEKMKIERLIKQRSKTLNHEQGITQQKYKIAFVSGWFGHGISGGAEALCLQLIKLIQRYFPEIEVEVITTTLKEFSANWNEPFHAEGTHIEDNIIVHRFHPTKPRREFFHLLNGTRLMPGGTQELKQNANCSPISPLSEFFYLHHMIQSQGMWDFLLKNKENFRYFFFTPYMFAPTIIGSQLVQEKAIIIPCLHDERYAFLELIKKIMTSSRASVYNVKSEMSLAQSLYGANLSKPFLLGVPVETNIEPGVPERFRTKFKIESPFILYAGRKIEGKGVHSLVTQFLNYKKTFQNDLKLVLVGRGDLDYSGVQDVIELGFLDHQDKTDAYAAAQIFCLPSNNESFSIVIMESWLQNRPVIVNAECQVTVDHCQDSQGGLWYRNQAEFNVAVNKLLHSKDLAAQMGRNGRNYVLNTYAPQKVAQRLKEILDELNTTDLGPNLKTDS